MVSLLASMTPLALLLPLFVGNDDLAMLTEMLHSAKTPEAKITMLEFIAHAGKESPAEKGKTAAMAISLALSDESVPVQLRAIELLGAGQDVDVAAVELLKRCHKQIEERREIDEAMKKLDEEWKELLAETDIGSLDPEDQEREQEHVLKSLKHLDAKLALSTKSVSVLEVRLALVKSFATIPDDCSVEGLGLLLKSQPGMTQRDLIRALLDHGTGAALTHVIANLNAHEQESVELEKELKKLKRAKPGTRPDKSVSVADWKAQEKARIEKEITTLEETLVARAKPAEDFAITMRVFALDKGLIPPPSELQPVRAWSAWCATESAKLPSSVTRP